MIGFTDPCAVDFSHEMSVTRVHEDPRVTKPYSDAQWAAIDALGGRVDADLAAHDVRLTQGGEPTFVSVDDMDGAEWNYTALSPKKRELGEALLRRLAQRFAPGGFLHAGQGKWYPGEPLPALDAGRVLARRRCFAVAGSGADRRHARDRPGRHRRRTTVCHRARRRAGTRTRRRDHRVGGRAEAHRGRGGASGERGPAAGRPFAADGVARLLRKGLDTPVGFVLPLRAVASEDRSVPVWETSPWPLRREHLYAIAGDSPLRPRLPLASLPEVLPADEETEPPVDPVRAAR